MGSYLVIEHNFLEKTVFVKEIATKRVSFEKAKKFYKIISEETKEKAKFIRTRPRYKPDKKVRRDLKALKEKFHFLSQN